MSLYRSHREESIIKGIEFNLSIPCVDSLKMAAFLVEGSHLQLFHGIDELNIIFTNIGWFRVKFI